jgi:hypothetical protein
LALHTRDNYYKKISSVTEAVFTTLHFRHNLGISPIS